MAMIENGVVAENNGNDASSISNILNQNASNAASSPPTANTNSNDIYTGLNSKLDSLILNNQTHHSLHINNSLMSFDDYHQTNKSFMQPANHKDSFLHMESSNLLDLNLFSRLSCLMNNENNQLNEQQNNNSTILNSYSSVSFCSYCLRPSEANLTTLECNTHRICSECFTFSLSSSSRKNSDGNLKSKKNSTSNEDPASPASSSSSTKATLTPTQTASTPPSSSASGTVVNNSSNISSSSSNTTNVSETSGSIESSSVSSTDDNNLDERFGNSIALKCKLCTVVESAPKNNEALNFNHDLIQQQSQSQQQGNTFYDTMFDLFPQYHSNSVIDVLKHLSLDQDEYNLAPSRLG